MIGDGIDTMKLYFIHNNYEWTANGTSVICNLCISLQRNVV